MHGLMRRKRRESLTYSTREQFVLLFSDTDRNYKMCLKICNEIFQYHKDRRENTYATEWETKASRYKR